MGLAPAKASRIRQALEDSQWVCSDPWSNDHAERPEPYQFG